MKPPLIAQVATRIDAGVSPGLAKYGLAACSAGDAPIINTRKSKMALKFMIFFLYT